MVSIDFGRCLLHLHLQNRKMSQTDLAIATGITRQEINAYVHNKRRMSFITAMKIAITIGCRVDALYEWEINK